MKNDKYLNLLEEFKVDDEFIDEALTGNSGDRGIKVYAGKTKPVKIIAPIAACLAVFAAAGIVFANRDKLPINPNSSLSPASESTDSDEEKLDYIMNEFNSRNEDSDIGTIISNDSEPKIKVYPQVVPPYLDTIFHRNCWDFITDKYADLLQGEITWWKDGDIDIDFDGEFESLVCPQIDYETVEGVNVCVFRRVGYYCDAEYLGKLSSNFTEKFFDGIYFVTDEANKCYYYFDCVEEYEKCIDTVYKIYYDKEANAVREVTYLQLVKTYPNDALSHTPYTLTAYRYGEEITEDQLMDEWRRIQNVSRDEEILPTPDVFDGHRGTNENIQILVDKYGLPMTANSLHRVVQYLDINLDGEDETVIEFRNCEQLKGFYVFSSDGRLIGEFDPDCYRKQGWGGIAGGMATYTDECLFLYSGSDESYYYYMTHHSGRDRYHSWLEEEIYKIAVNADGTLSAVPILEENHGLPDDECYKINGKAVTSEEYWKEENKYSDHLFPSVSRDPFVW